MSKTKKYTEKLKVIFSNDLGSFLMLIVHFLKMKTNLCGGMLQPFFFLKGCPLRCTPKLHASYFWQRFH